MAALIDVPPAELVQLCAVDNRLYERTFFSKTVRQAAPEFHYEIDAALESDARYVALMIHRDGAKTSKFRMFVSKRIAYGLTHTGLLVSNSQSHSIKTLDWIKRQIEFNTLWASTFQLRKGGRWTSEEIEIIHGIDEYPIYVLALGMTGQLRGFNLNDRRPDFIGADDIDNEETAGSIEQKKKSNDLFFGALAKSLAPASEAPHAKMVLMQTPIAYGDVIDTCRKDPQWLTLKFGCFDERGNSRWPERYPTEVLLADKKAHIDRGQLALWMREKECEIVPEGGASFKPDNLKYFELLPENPIYLVAIDPASSESKTADDQVAMLLAFWKRNIYVVDYTAEKGELPEVIANTIIQWSFQYTLLGIWVETIGYQRVLKTFLEQAMAKARRYVAVHAVQDRRKKSDRIIQAIGNASALGRLFIRTTQTKLIQQYTSYSPLSREHDDVLDAVAMGIEAGEQMQINDWLEGEYETINEPSLKKLEFRSCP
jgi:predicted phage terminase large subunit-like protein